MHSVVNLKATNTVNINYFLNKLFLTVLTKINLNFER
jgi:hypothetical protein